MPASYQHSPQCSNLPVRAESATFPAGKISIDQHQNTTYAGLASDRSLARPAYVETLRQFLWYLCCGTAQKMLRTFLKYVMYNAKWRCTALHRSVFVCCEIWTIAPPVNISFSFVWKRVILMKLNCFGLNHWPRDFAELIMERAALALQGLNRDNSFDGSMDTNTRKHKQEAYHLAEELFWVFKISRHKEMEIEAWKCKYCPCVVLYWS